MGEHRTTQEVGGNVDIIAQEAARTIDAMCATMAASVHGLDPKAISGCMSGALRGYCAATWRMRDKRLTKAQIVENLTAAIVHGIDMEERAELMEGVGGNG